ncbi:MAG: PHP domain-containing protein, partial [Rhodocyclaceae bacterium]|nr:PHP domain-containing protein [Rhodocyclaceae bacterium]
MLPAYAELHCLSCFSFLRGASQPEELVARARELGYGALAITDECSFAGAVRAHLAAQSDSQGNAAKEASQGGAAGSQGDTAKAAEPAFRLLIGTELRLAEGPKLVLLARNRAGYGNLSALVTLGRRRTEKGSYELRRGDLAG